MHYSGPVLKRSPPPPHTHIHLGTLHSPPASHAWGARQVYLGCELCAVHWCLGWQLFRHLAQGEALFSHDAVVRVAPLLVA